MSELPNDDSELEPSRVSLLSPVWSERKERRSCSSRVLVRERVCESVREKVDEGFYTRFGWCTLQGFRVGSKGFAAQPAQLFTVDSRPGGLESWSQPTSTYTHIYIIHTYNT
ncbi:hypothetical protein HanRHA438_Chr14g0634511 [Helianthus annuus]|nr:hypothetical protein HanRHA438_Chr14g0634511 [Helianthus annuus]